MEKKFKEPLALLNSSRLLWMASIALLSVGLLLFPHCIKAREGYLLNSQERDWLAAHPLISLAPDPDYPPIEYFDESGEYRGIAADYVSLIEKRLGFRFKISRLQSWDEALDKARRKEIDMFGAAAQTPQRSEYMLFTHSFVEFPSVVIVRKSVSEPLSLEKLDGMKVAVVSGYADHDYIKNNYPRLQLDEVPTVVTGLRKVSFGMVDALVTNLASATYYIEKEGITNLRLAGKTGYMFQLGFGVRKDWPELISILEKGLAEIAPREREAIFKKWVKLEDESLFAHREFRIITFSGLSVAIFVVLGLLWWNRSLKSAVYFRTEELSKELAERKRTKEALRQSETRYRILYESLRDAFVQVSMDGRIIEFNDLFCQMLGYSPEEVLTLTYQQLTPERWHEFEESIVREQIIPRGYSEVYQKEYRRKDGTTFPVELRTILSRDALGRPSAMWAIVRDITKRKKAEEALRHSELRFRLLSETAGQLLTAPNPQEIVNELCQKVMEYLDFHAFFNFLVDESVGKLHLNACGGIPEEEARRIEWLDYGVAVCGCVAQTWECIMAEDIFHTPDIRTDLVRSYGIQAYACHPLMVQGKLIGTLSFGTKTHSHFSPEEISVMKTVSDQVATAMERMVLIGELTRSRDELEFRIQERTTELTKLNKTLKKSEGQLRYLSSTLLDVQETERKRISDEIHDSVGQSLHAIRAGLKELLSHVDRSPLDAARINDLLLTTEFGIEEVKNIYMGLRPSLIDDLGVVATLGWYMREFRKTYPDIHLEEDISVGEEKIREDVKIIIFRVLQGALDNVVRHSHAGRARVSLKEIAGKLELLIEDSGSGFDSGELGVENGQAKGIGLVSMQERVESSGGTFMVKSAMGQGTTIRAIWDIGRPGDNLQTV